VKQDRAGSFGDGVEDRSDGGRPPIEHQAVPIGHRRRRVEDGSGLVVHER